jgi:hypothetical protein
MRVIPVAYVIARRTIGGNERLWSRREDARSMYDRATIERKSMKVQVNMRQVVNHKDALQNFC